MLITGLTKDASDCCAAHDVAPGGAVTAAGAEVSAHRSNLDSEIDMTEAQIGELQKKVADLRARRPQEAVKNYEFARLERFDASLVTALWRTARPHSRAQYGRCLRILHLVGGRLHRLASRIWRAVRLLW